MQEYTQLSIMTENIKGEPEQNSSSLNNLVMVQNEIKHSSTHLNYSISPKTSKIQFRR
jgi:hypothetical protein